jgi:hypothetical protein
MGINQRRNQKLGIISLRVKQKWRVLSVPIVSTLFLLLSPIFATNVQAQVTQVTSVTIPLEPVQPSLWWISERVDEGLVESLSIDITSRIVKVGVNPNVWDLADYIKRYSFLQRLGNVALERDYGILLQDRRQRTLAEYLEESGTWRIAPANLGATPFRANLSNPFAVRQ